ncbi:MAG: hypothetical protein FWD58_04345, partial [Firmicutes bacterium]|nr:hypothetical protein [Bacillota bacterium]
MNLKTFLWDKLLAIVFNIAGIIAAGVFVGFAAGLAQAFIVAAAWVVVLAIYCAVSYLILQKR